MRSVGENRAPQAALTDSPRSNGWPETGFAEKIFPSSSIKTRTLTAPVALTALAAGGYFGRGRAKAFPFKTPPEIVCDCPEVLELPEAANPPGAVLLETVFVEELVSCDVGSGPMATLSLSRVT